MHTNAIEDVTDEALLVAFGNGDAQAARELTLRLTPMVLGYATRMLGDRTEAEDVSQDAMLRLWNVAAEWRQGEAKVSTWLYRVVANLCTDRLRKKRFSPIDGIAEPADGAKSALATIEDTQRQFALEKALVELPERQRQAVVLRHLEGLSNPEIAAVMEISVEAVESLSARGKRTLSVLLSGRRKELGYDND